MFKVLHPKTQKLRYPDTRTDTHTDFGIAGLLDMRTVTRGDSNGNSWQSLL